VTLETDAGASLASGDRVVTPSDPEPRVDPGAGLPTTATGLAGTASGEAVTPGRANPAHGHRAERLVPREVASVLGHPAERACPNGSPPEAARGIVASATGRRARRERARVTSGLVAVALRAPGSVAVPPADRARARPDRVAGASSGLASATDRRGAPAKGRAGSDRAVVARHEARPMAVPHAEAPGAISGLVDVGRRAPDSAVVPRADRARVRPDRLAVASSEPGSATDRRATPERTRVSSGLVAVALRAPGSVAAPPADRARPSPDRVAGASSGPASATDLRAELTRGRAGSDRAVVARHEADPLAVRPAEAAGAISGLVDVARRGPDSVAVPPADRARARPGLVDVASSGPASAADLRAAPTQGRAGSDRAVVARHEAGPVRGRRAHPGRAWAGSRPVDAPASRADSAHVVPAPARHAARVRAARASVAAHPALGAIPVGRAASAHCPAVVVHDDPAPAPVVEVEVGGVAGAAERAPPSPG